ncbi:MAG: hypothetical protein SNJ72_07205 [Fimbriimonadales bacterium]
MAHVLIVSPRRNLAMVSREAMVLRNLGIPCTIAVLNGTGASAFETPIGALDPTSADARAYLRQFDAVFVIEPATHLAQGTANVDASLRWLSWNDPEDPPVCYFGTMFSTARTSATPFIPSDFPLVRPNASDLANTAYMLDAGATWGSTTTKVGTRVALTREGLSVYIPSVNWRTSTNESGFWRLNPTNHSALGANGEILAVPSQPDGAYPPEAVIAYRYRKHCLLPMVYLFGMNLLVHWQPSTESTYSGGVFWLLYALKLCNIAPAWSIPFHFETDHPLQLGNTRVDGMTFDQQLGIQRDTYDWLVGFCEPRGLCVHHGIQVGGRDRTRTGSPQAYDHWTLLNRPDLTGTDAQLVAQQAHSILVAHHLKTQPCGPHDHTMPGSGLNLSANLFTLGRHSGGQYGAPNDVPVGHGIAINKRYAPDSFTGLEYSLDGAEWLETAMPTSGMGTSVPNVRDGSYHIARIVVEGHIEELKAMGFPDGLGGVHGYTNTAKNSSGGLGYCQAYRDAGYRALRSHHCPNGQWVVTPNRVWNGFHLLNNITVDAHGTAPQGGYGLYHPSAPSDAHAVGRWSLDINGDITGDFPNTAWRAYRRLLALHTMTWLGITATTLGVAYLHPVTCFGASPFNPTARFGEGISNLAGYPHHNHMVELLCEMDIIIQVLSPYLRWGSVTDLLDLRDRVLI